MFDSHKIHSNTMSPIRCQKELKKQKNTASSVEVWSSLNIPRKTQSNPVQPKIGEYFWSFFSLVCVCVCVCGFVCEVCVTECVSANKAVRCVRLLAGRYLLALSLSLSLSFSFSFSVPLFSLFIFLPLPICAQGRQRRKSAAPPRQKEKKNL